MRDVESDQDSEVEDHLHSTYAADLSTTSLEASEIDPADIDAYWLQRKVNSFCQDAENSLNITEEVLPYFKTFYQKKTRVAFNWLNWLN